MTHPLARRALAEGLGTAALLIAVVGSGIMAQRLSPHDTGLQLLENSIATGAALVAIIVAFGSVSGAHLNPVVTLADRAFGGLTTARETVTYISAQVAGAVLGTVVANLMFDLPAVEWSTHARSGSGIWLGEVVATLGLLVVIFGAVRSGRAAIVPFVVGAYIAAAYWFTSSTSFANPAVTIGRAFTDTFAGIAPESVPAFVAFQLVGLAAALGVIVLLYPRVDAVATDVVMPHEGTR
jgi:glycerol uptake facilitator-like aquaporin